MKRTHVVAVFALLACSLALAVPSARAQGARHDDVVRNEQGLPAAGATVVVCTQPANVTVTPCTPLANLYTDSTLTTPAPNPLTSDGLGNYHFYAAPGVYTVQVYGPGINTYTTPDVLLPANPSNAQFGSITATNSISALTLNLGGNLSVGGNANVTGTLTAGAFNASLAATSNAQLKGTGVILYADSAASGCGGIGCSDLNDGKSWGSAMATVDHAICSLPGGNCSTSTAGSGTVYFTDGTPANSTSACGLWLMGPNDPNYSSAPACWLKVTNAAINGLAIIGMPKSDYGPNAAIPRAWLAGGWSGSRNYPGIWLSATSEPIYIGNTNVQYPGRGIVVGECSNNTRTGACNSSGIYFDNDTANPNSAAGDGPAWDITGQSFWIRMRNCGGSGTDSANTPTGDLSPAVLIDGRTNAGNGLIFINDFNAAGGGIKLYAGTNGGSVNITNLTTEGQKGEPAVWFASSGSAGDGLVTATINKVVVSDPTATTPGVEVDIPSGAGILANDILGGTINLVGPMHTDAQYVSNLQDQVISPQRSGQTGSVLGWNYGKRDDVQRSAGLTTVRFANQVRGSSCSTWVANPSGATVTCGVADPFGGTNAGQASASSGGQYALQFLPGSSGVDTPSLPVGSYIIAGVWTRSQTANGYAGNAFLDAALSITGTGVTASGGCDGDSVLGDGEWTWNRCIYKITATGGTELVEFAANFDPTHTIQAYAPVVNFIPAGTMSDNEAYAYFNSLKTYDALCAVGADCGMEFNPIEAPIFETESANPAQSGALRLSDADVVAWRNHANTGDVALSKNSSDQLVAPPFASPTLFSPIIDSSSGASGLTFRNSGSTVWTATAGSSSLSFNFNAHLGETSVKLAPFGGQSYAGLVDNYGMTAGFVPVTEAGGTISFDAGLGNTFEVTLNAGATSSTLSNAQAGQWLNFIVCQPASGGPYTFAWPSNVRGGMTIGSAAGKCSAQSFVFDGSSAFAVSPGAASD